LVTACRTPAHSTTGFKDLRLHDLHGSNKTHLLDRGMSPAAVAARWVKILQRAAELR